MSQYYDRYSRFRSNNSVMPVPGITIPDSDSDKYAIYNQGQTRLDKLSDMYYNNPYTGWLILLANPQYGGLEFNIPDMSSLRIPFPFDSAISRYTTEVNIYKDLYGGL